MRRILDREAGTERAPGIAEPVVHEVHVDFVDSLTTAPSAEGAEDAADIAG